MQFDVIYGVIFYVNVLPCRGLWLVWHVCSVQLVTLLDQTGRGNRSYFLLALSLISQKRDDISHLWYSRLCWYASPRVSSKFIIINCLKIYSNLAWFNVYNYLVNHLFYVLIILCLFEPRFTSTSTLLIAYAFPGKIPVLLVSLSSNKRISRNAFHKVLGICPARRWELASRYHKTILINTYLPNNCANCLHP